MIEDYNSPIYDFTGKNHFLSNFFERKITYNGITYDNSEAAFHAQKDLSRTKEFIHLTPAQSKKLGRKVNLRSDWEQVKDQIMYEIVKAKFEQNEDLKNKLIATGDVQLTEGTLWHDNYWGDCFCPKCSNKPGLNKLGLILMKIRKELKEEKN